jgi:hypothetical protein
LALILPTQSSLSSHTRSFFSSHCLLKSQLDPALSSQIPPRCRQSKGQQSSGEPVAPVLAAAAAAPASSCGGCCSSGGLTSRRVSGEAERRHGSGSGGATFRGSFSSSSTSSAPPASPLVSRRVGRMVLAGPYDYTHPVLCC